MCSQGRQTPRPRSEDGAPLSPCYLPGGPGLRSPARHPLRFPLAPPSPDPAVGETATRQHPHPRPLRRRAHTNPTPTRLHLTQTTQGSTRSPSLTPKNTSRASGPQGQPDGAENNPSPQTPLSHEAGFLRDTQPNTRLLAAPPAPRPSHRGGGGGGPVPGGRSQPLLQPVAAVSAVPSHILSTPLPSCLAGTHGWKWLSRLLQPLGFFFLL